MEWVGCNFQHVNLMPAGPRRCQTQVGGVVFELHQTIRLTLVLDRVLRKNIGILWLPDDTDISILKKKKRV